MKEAVRKYTAAGFSCLPTKKDKTPAVSAWKGIEISPEAFIAYGIGVKCGIASGNMECIDFDNHFGDAKDILTDFMNIEGVRNIYVKHKLPIQSTTSGGYHLLYRCRLVEGNMKLARRAKMNKEKNRPEADVLIETRGEGGYFIIAPTSGYECVKNDLCIVNEITKGERDILLTAAKTFNTWVDHNYKTNQDGERPGTIFNNDVCSLDEMRDALLSAGWADLNGGKWRRPGKKEGVSATLGKAADKIFYNFSGSAYPFDMDHGYTAFQVVGLLKYDGNFKQFASELAERYELNKKQSAKIGQGIKQKEEPTTTDLDEILRRSMIDFNIPIAKPPVILRIKAQMGKTTGYSRVLTLGNFSAITGKSKSKKTYLTTLMMTAAVRGGYYDKVFSAELPLNRRGVILFDTEQSNYDAYVTAKRIPDLLGYQDEGFGAFDLREFSALERCRIIERAIEKVHNYVSLIVIDGIADLAMAINDEIEASRVVSLLMKWTKMYNVHIVNVIHQNKNDEYATGHLGSAILKKAECIISVRKDIQDSSRSEVHCDLIRGAGDFDNFNFSIDSRGLPVVDEEMFISKIPERP